MNLYHYRSVESARKEIECRTFRYADRNELNDPLEGYAQIYWKGDCPAWEGLFRNYICSVYYAVVGIQLNASEELLAERAVIPDIHCFDDVPLGQVWKELSDRFVQTALVQKLIVDLGNTETEMNAHRLRQILRLCHEGCNQNLSGRHAQTENVARGAGRAGGVNQRKGRLGKDGRLWKS